MTFSEKVTKMIDIIKNARLHLIAKGETVPYDDDIPDVIEQMSGGGITPTGTINITSNGTHDVTQYASANVNVTNGDTQQLIKMIDRSANASIIIPSGANFISHYVFYNFIDLKSVVIPDTVTSIGNQAFWNCYNMTTCNLPNTVINIGNQCFQECSSLPSINIPNSVTSIGNGCFYGCKNATSIILGSSLVTIPTDCFRSCVAVQSVVIPNSITSIGARAFLGCSLLAIVDLTSFTDPANIPTLLDVNAFNNIASNCVYLVANAEMQAAFSSATNWSNFTFTIQGA